MQKSKKISLTKIKPYWRNPRKNDKTVVAVKASLEEFGPYQDIVVDSEMVIIVGHSRYKAAKELGWKDFPCRVADDLSADQVRRMRIADNKTSELAEWDQGLLSQELREILDVESFQIYFGSQDISKLLDVSVGIQKQAVTGKQIADKGQEMNDKFVKGDQERRANSLLEFTCPHCAEEFEIDKSYVVEQFGLGD